MGVARYDWLDVLQLAPYDVLSSGWEALICDLFAEIDGLITGSGVGMQLLQVKEKFGSVRIYYRLHDATPLLATQVAAVVCKAESDSYRTCFTCGGPGSIRWIGGWVVPMCDKHAALEARETEEALGAMRTGSSIDPER